MTRGLRARVAWAPGFGGHDGGFSGAGTTVAFLDTGFDASHPDLAIGEAYFSDFTSDALASAADYSGHGTAVAGVAVGSGRAFGAGPGRLRFTADGSLAGLASGSWYRHPFHAPVGTRVRLNATATFTGGTETQLAFRTAADGTRTWSNAIPSVSGTSPLTLSLDLQTNVLGHQSFALAAPADRYAVAATLDPFPAATDGANALRGVAPGARWASFKVFRKDGSGESSDVFDALEALVTPPPGETASLAAVLGIKVANISFGIGANDQAAPELRASVRRLRSGERRRWRWGVRGRKRRFPKRRREWC